MINKINLLVTFKQKVSLVLVFLIFFVNSFLEVLSVGSIPIFISYILQPDLFTEKIPFENLKKLLENYFESKETIEILGVGCLIIFLFFLFKNIYFVLANIFEARINRSIKYSINTNIFKYYLYAPYDVHLVTNPSKILRNIYTSSTAANQITCIMILIREILIVLGILILVVSVGYYVSLLLVLSIFVILIIGFMGITGTIKKKSRQSVADQTEMYKIINQFIGSITEIKTKGKEKFFSSKYNKTVFSYETINLFLVVLRSIPKIFLETIAVSGLLLVVYFFSKTNTNLYEVIPFLALITLGMIRVLPSFNRILTVIADIKYQKIYFDLICDEITKLKKIQSIHSIDQTKNIKKINSKIVLKDISFQYQDTLDRSLKNISLEIKRGEKVGFVGKSGSGKSTLFKIILGLLNTSQGKIIIDDVEVNNNDRIIWKNLSYIPQDIYILDDSIKNNIAFGTTDQDLNKEYLNKVIKCCELEEFIKSSPDGINTIVGDRGIRISGGQKQRLSICRALYSKPEILFMDEATSNIDNETEEKIIKNLKNFSEEITIIAIAHKLSTLKYFDKIFIIEEGKIKDSGDFNKLKELPGY